jgi:hypothetical protein
MSKRACEADFVVLGAVLVFALLMGSIVFLVAAHG